MGNYLFTSESVAMGHPDKIADQISDAILDACLEKDPFSRVACETLVTAGLVMLVGEITTTANVNYQDVVRRTIQEIGYQEGFLGFDFRSCGILASLHTQSPDIALGIQEEALNEMGAGDQGSVFGYASDETPQLMPWPIALAHAFVRELYRLRVSKELPYLRPDGKVQVTVEYNEYGCPLRVHNVVISTQHSADVDNQTIYDDMRCLARRIVPPQLMDSNTLFFINPTGRFVLGGPVVDTGLTGRKIIVDTYGGMARHGGGAFSGKDPTKIDRSACYMARYIAKNLVKANLARRCEIQLSYAIGVSRPTALHIQTFGTSKYSSEQLEQAVRAVFPLTPHGLIEMLDLRRPIYKKTAFSGHFGREDPEFTWEKTDQVQALQKAIEKHVP
ncbi:methionine adenosyltransferase [Parachlamydia sp. AcF125]|uniref:methionine adenosyltransferase n=1 Tax=Parachlamydia sp. AcF125 TaxID=2795736 RepID=UPI001BC912DA|nr:methionine adenosyltransferase [Parachlamydia sp. AcF125]MBS4167916.1 S-adenosylmethionine synthase [Parachlamydia sp. AcF125]